MGCDCKIFRPEQARSASLGKDAGEMGFAATRRPMENEGLCRPVGPTIKPSDRLRIARGNKEILAPVRRPLLEIEGELRRRHHRSIHRRAVIINALTITLGPETDDHPGGGGHRHGEQDPGETEELASSQ